MERLKGLLWGGRQEELSRAQKAARSVTGFVLGMVLASFYGVLVLLVQSANAWFCLLSTAALGAALGLGMGFSIKVRMTVLLSLPHVFTSKEWGGMARTLRNVWIWLNNIGDICNEEMGTPYFRCLRVFADAKDNCERALSFLFFLCYIIISFRPLCGLAARLSYGVIGLERGALRYRYRYFLDDSFDNIYITERFVRMDAQRALQGQPTLLPLRAMESIHYIHPGMPWLSEQEKRRYGMEMTTFLRYVLLGLSLVLVDYSLFWLLDLIRHQMQGEIVARAPAVIAVRVDGSGYTSDIYRDVVSSFDVLQRGNVSVLSQRCLLRPVEPDYSTYTSMEWGWG
ncbi:DC-STAMP domain-containing protein 2 [Coturnix japonica]|uniref:DC-STAMP domain-containing protein 2 n=1 Tax=Coturnix japonica TaxID=93934 RepID=UPI0013A5C60D|nr:DC-STAMP domain-containing protein 2 [Coturnix japonica]